jgi:AcrR family transcriptional regulator
MEELLATQLQRSAATREKLLDAAVSALIERGHAGASLPEICRRAGVSRGAQLHHFPTRADLLSAAVDHLFELRHREFRAQLQATPLGAEATLTELWALYTSGPLYAWLELVVASRVDPDLRKALAGVDRRFMQQAEQTLMQFPLPPGVQPRAAARLITSLLDGLATNRILRDDDKSAREVLALATQLLRPVLETT